MGTEPVSANQRQTLSIAIVAKNEGENLRRILPTVVWADEIVLIDSGSTDGTVALAESFGVRVLYQPWPGYGPQVNNALRACTMQWVFSLDADECFTAELALEIQALLSSVPPLEAYWVPRRNYFLGRAIYRGGFYPDRKLRLFRNGKAWAREDTEPHATPKYAGIAGRLKHDMLHYAYPTLSLYIEHMNRYSSAGVPLVLRRNKRSSGFIPFLWNVLANPAATFLYNYVLRGGFLEGREGLLLHLYHSFYVSMKYAKAWEAARTPRDR
jgi:glycosyltransferase involved in cell wall biosynthesis